MASTYRPAEGLLEHVAEHALDDDYYVVRAGEPYGERPIGTVWVGVVVALLAALLTVAAVQTQYDRPGSDLERRTLAADVSERREVLSARERAVSALRGQVVALQGGTPLAPGAVGPDVDVVSGSEPVEGEALVVTVAGSPDDSREGRVTAQDLLVIVNGLWYAGAEAISVGGQRLTSMSSIGTVDDTLTVNFSRVDPPVRIVAIGDGRSLRTRLESNAAGRYLTRRAESAGLSVGMARSDDEKLPAAPARRAELRHARPLPADQQAARGEGDG